jgi:hypothetical protein
MNIIRGSLILLLNFVSNGLVNHEKSNKIRVMEDWFSMKNAFACSCFSTFSCQTYLENIWLEEVEVRIVQHLLRK